MDLKLYCQCPAFHGDCFCSVAPCLNTQFDCIYLLLCYMSVFVIVCNVQPYYLAIKLNITLSIILTKELICFSCSFSFFLFLLLFLSSHFSFSPFSFLSSFDVLFFHSSGLMNISAEVKISYQCISPS